MKIMIVDDSKTFREAIRHLLEKNPDYTVVAEAENGKQALEVSKKIFFDIVLMDIEMPVLNGIEATKILLHRNSSLKIIAVTSYHDKLYLEDIIGAGFKAFVNKNKVFDQLEEVIYKVNWGIFIMPDNMKVSA